MNEIEKIEMYIKGLHKDIIDEMRAQWGYWRLPYGSEDSYKVIYKIADIIGERCSLLKYENENLQMPFCDLFMLEEGRPNTKNWPEKEKEFWGIT